MPGKKGLLDLVLDTSCGILWHRLLRRKHFDGWGYGELLCEGCGLGGIWGCAKEIWVLVFQIPEGVWVLLKIPKSLSDFFGESGTKGQ